MSVKIFFHQLFTRISENKTTTWAASLAFYMALSLAPLLILFLSLSSLLSQDLQTTFEQQVNQLMGPVAAEGVSTVINSAKDRPDLMSISGIIGTVTLLISAGLIFGQMREALNEIFEKRSEPHKEGIWNTIRTFLKTTFIRIALVFGFLIAMIGSLIVSTLISAYLHTDQALMAASLNIIVSFLFYILLFTGLFHYVPNGKMPWREAFEGGAVTAVLFLFGKELIGLYLGQGALSSSYGAAGSVVALLAWVYYSAMIIFVGAHVSYLLQKKFKRFV